MRYGRHSCQCTGIVLWAAEIGASLSTSVPIGIGLYSATIKSTCLKSLLSSASCAMCNCYLLLMVERREDAVNLSILFSMQFAENVKR